MSKMVLIGADVTCPHGDGVVLQRRTWVEVTSGMSHDEYSEFVSRVRSRYGSDYVSEYRSYLVRVDGGLHWVDSLELKER